MRNERSPQSPIRRVSAIRVSAAPDGMRNESHDRVVVEEPLEIRYASKPVATLMRTPLDDIELAIGYLYVEGWVRGPSDIGAVALCPRTVEHSGPAPRNVADFLPAEGVEAPSNVSRRRSTATSSCGVCGKETIDEVMEMRPPALREPRAPPVTIQAEWLPRLPEALRGQQEVFDATGALHGAGLFDSRGDLLLVREDIGRHNAVDKVIGWALLEDRLPLDGCILQVSGRVSFEIIQKAYRAGIPVVTAVSGVSSLAIEFAERAQITLIGFLRGTSYTVYSGAQRILD